MSTLVDFQTHVFPDFLKLSSSTAASGQNPNQSLTLPLGEFRRKAKHWVQPWVESAHLFQTYARYLPSPLRRTLDEVGSFLPILGIGLESNENDLRLSMEETGIEYAVIWAHLPWISNEFVLSIAQRNPQLIPGVEMSRFEENLESKLREYVSQGARALKLYASRADENKESSRYEILLKTAQELGIPVLLYAAYSSLTSKKNGYSHAESFFKWYEQYPNIPFVLAQMNFHDPHLAFKWCERFPNLYLETSWQPTEVIGAAIQQVGAERILFGSAWPWIGRNMHVGVDRIRECIQTGDFSKNHQDAILGKNALMLLKKNLHAC